MQGQMEQALGLQCQPCRVQVCVGSLTCWVCFFLHNILCFPLSCACDSSSFPFPFGDFPSFFSILSGRIYLQSVRNPYVGCKVPRPAQQTPLTPHLGTTSHEDAAATRWRCGWNCPGPVSEEPGSSPHFLPPEGFLCYSAHLRRGWVTHLSIHTISLSLPLPGRCQPRPVPHSPCTAG